tara:strand:+ start:349 stop:633 length:285 start_codon:yes stop_codon:yes gene_type:complete
MQIQDLSNFRKFNITFIAPTNQRGSRVKITEPKRYDTDKAQSVTLSYSYEVGDIAQQALNYLIEKGFKPVSRCSDFNSFTILCDNWGEDFTQLK